MARENIESELKIPVTDLDTIRTSLVDAEARPAQPMARETNLLLDSADHRLREQGCVLRLRHSNGRAILTFKGPATFHGAVKQRAENETDIADLDSIIEVFKGLGFRVFMRYQKDREKWVLGDASVFLDHTPMGDFVEVEGPVEQIEDVARSLGLETTDAVRGSYPSLWLEHRQRHTDLDLPFDMVFPG